MADKKPISKEYLLTQLKNFDKEIINKNYTGKKQAEKIEKSIGDVTTIKISSVTDLVTAINALYDSFMSSITYADKKLTIAYRNGKSTIVDISSIIVDTNLGELSNVNDEGVQDKQVLSYDEATSKYVPTSLDLAGLLKDSKDYTDEQVSKINSMDAIAVDEKPTCSDGVITYKKDGETLTAENSDIWFYYSVDDMNYQTLFIDGIEFTTSVDGDVDFKDFVSKTNDVVSTYTGEETNKDKVVTIGALDALYTIIATALGKKVNTADIVDTLESDAVNKPLSANQGKVLNAKIDEHINDEDSHVSADEKAAWNKAQKNIIETVKVNGEELTPDENKAIDIDLSDYASHDEVIAENLIPFPYADGMSKTMNGIDYTVNEDGSVTAVGTAIDTSYFLLANTLYIDPTQTYTLSGDLDDESSYNNSAILFNENNASGASYWNYGKNKPKTFSGLSVIAFFRIRISKDAIVNQTFYPMLEVGTISHKYQKYNLSRESLRTDVDNLTESNQKIERKVNNQFGHISGSNVYINDSVDGNVTDLKVYGKSEQKQYSGKNLLNSTLNTSTKNGITCTQNIGVDGKPDGTYTLNGTATDGAYFDINNNNPLVSDIKYKLVGCPKDSKAFLCVRKISANVALGYDRGDGVEFTTTENGYVFVAVSSGVTVTNEIIKPMISSDLSVTYDDFEPYVGGVPSPNPEYPQEIKSIENLTVTTSDGYEPHKSSSTITIPLSNPLRNIGNLKDEITYQNGKWGVLRRIDKYTVKGTENYNIASNTINNPYGMSVAITHYTDYLDNISVVNKNTIDMVNSYFECLNLNWIPYYSDNVTEDKGCGTYRTDSNIWFSFGVSYLEKLGITRDVESVKKWFTENEVTILYPLKTPVFEEFANQSLPHSLITYDGVTNITNSANTEMEVKYPLTNFAADVSKDVAELRRDMTFKTASTTWKGLTFVFYKQGRIGYVRTYGKLTSELAISDAYDETVQAPEGFEPAFGDVSYLISNRYRVQFNAQGKKGFKLGYAVSIIDGSTTNIPVGTDIYIQRSYIIA